MRIDIPSYNTYVEFPDLMQPEKAMEIVRQKFPPILTGETGVTENPSLVNPLGRNYAQPPSFLDNAKKSLMTLSKVLGAESIIGSDDPEAIDEVVQAGKATTQAMAHTVRGAVAFPVSKAVGSYVNLTFGADMAKKAEEKLSALITGEPSTEAGKEMFQTIGTAASVPFIPAQKVGELLGEVSPEIGYAVGTGLEIISPMLLHMGIKNAVGFGKVYKAMKQGKELSPILRDHLESMPEIEREAAMNFIDAVSSESPTIVISELKKAGMSEKEARQFIEDVREPEPTPTNAPQSTKQGGGATKPLEKSWDTIILERGGLHSKKIRNDYNWQEDVIQQGGLRLMRKNGRALDDLATELQGEGILGPTPDNYPGAGDYLWAVRNEQRQKIATRVETNLTKEEVSSIKEITEEMRNAGYTDSEVETTLREIQRDLGKKVDSATLEEIARREESLLEEGFIPEEDSPLLSEGTQSGLFTEKQAPFTLSGQQPFNQRTMQPGTASKGERLFDVQKQTPDQLAERLKPSPYQEVTSRISSEISKEIGETPIGKARGLTIEETVSIPEGKRLYRAKDPEMEQAFRDAHGVSKEPVWDKVKDVLTNAWEDLSRTYKHLSNDEPATVWLKYQERKFTTSMYETFNAMRGETKNFTPYQMDLYGWKVLLDDLKYTGEQGKDLPRGFTLEKVSDELGRIDAEIGKDPQIQAMLDRRREVQKALVDEYVDLRKYFGDDVSRIFSNENYYRHQVLDYATVKGAKGSGERLRVVPGRGFSKERKGSELPINTNYLEAEYEWRSQMVYDVETMKTLKRIEQEYNIADRLKKEAKAQDIEDWRDTIPDDYRLWQAREGNVFYTVDSIPEKIARELRDGVLEEIGITTDDLRTTLAIGGKRREIVIPESLAKTLDSFAEKPKENIIGKYLFREPLRAWKVWTLISPRRWAKYNIRNMTGDTEAAFLGNPSTFTKAWESTNELYGVLFRDKPIEGKLKEFFDRSGFDTTLQAQEIGDINAMRIFKNLEKEEGGLKQIPKKAWDAWWRTARMTTDFRELILRYAAYLDYSDQLATGKGTPKNWGASSKAKIEALTDYGDKAYELSNDLLGAYDRIGVFGQWFRSHAFPFWSWKEVNFKRYMQLMKNTAEDGELATLVGKKILGSVGKSPYTAYKVGSFMLKASALWGITQAINLTFFPEEEKDIPIEERSRPHIILGRDANGKVNYFSRIGMLGDFLSIFGLDVAPKLVENWINGKQSLPEIAQEMAKSPVNDLVSGLNPFIKVPFEIAMRQQSFPDVFNMATIRDRGLYLARQLNLQNEYKSIMGIPYEGYLSTMPETFYYKADPGQTAYSYIYDEQKRFLGKLGKEVDGFMLTPRGNALYNIRLAIRYKDEDALVKNMERYHALLETTGDEKKAFKNMKQSLKRMEPLAQLSKKEKALFIQTLDEEGLDKLEKAVVFYNRVLRGDNEVIKEVTQ